MGSNSKLAIPLYVGDPTAHAGCDFADDMGADALLDLTPSTPARIESISPTDTYFCEQFGLPGQGSPRELPAGVMALIKTNLTQDDGTGIGARVRFQLGHSAAPSAPTRMAPTAIVDNTFGAGTFTDVDDDPFAPDGSYMRCTSIPSAQAAIFTFGGGHADFVPGAKGQMVVCLVDTDSAFNAIEIELYESDALVESLSSSVITFPSLTDHWPTAGDDPQLFVAYFDSSLLSSASATPQIRVSVNGLGIRLQAIAIYPTTTADTADLYDSGWFIALPDITDDAFDDLSAAWVGDYPSRNVIRWPDSGNPSAPIPQGALYWCVAIRDPFNLDGFEDIGDFVAGARFETAIGRDVGKLIEIRPLGEKHVSAGGQHNGVAADYIRSILLPLSWMSPSEAAALAQRIRRMTTLSRAIISLASDSAVESDLLSAFGTLSTVMEYAAPHGLIRGMTVVLDEEY